MIKFIQFPNNNFTLQRCYRICKVLILNRSIPKQHYYLFCSCIIYCLYLFTFFALFYVSLDRKYSAVFALRNYHHIIYKW